MNAVVAQPFVSSHAPSGDMGRASPGLLERDFSQRKGTLIGDQAIAVGGLVGFALAWGTVGWWSGWSAGLPLLVVTSLTLIPMVLLSVFGARTHLRTTTGLESVPDRTNVARVATKFLGLLGTLAALAFAYWVFPEYGKAKYAPVWEAAILAAIPILPAAWFYFVWADQRMTEPHDGYWAAGCLALGKWQGLDWGCLREYALGWTIKGFFIPFMASGLAAQFGSLTTRTWDLSRFDQLYLGSLTLIYCVDILFGMLGYLLTLRILDAQIRSVQPDVLGWVVTLLCYTPFSAALATFQKYSSNDVDWSTLFRGLPLVFLTWGFVILCCLVVYVWSTVSFGCRFSNLTNRGIIMSGPYRWMKHPAYVSKNLAWWLMHVPFCAFTGWQDNLRASLMLGSINLIYFLRAKTEEKHLMADPAYRIYSRWMSRFGLVGSLKAGFRFLGWNVPPIRKALDLA